MRASVLDSRQPATMSQEAINAGRKWDAQAKTRQQANKPNGDEVRQSIPIAHEKAQAPSLFEKLKKWLGF